MGLIGKNVVYLGGCGGIGAATCRLLVKQKIKGLAILDVNENTQLIEGLKSQNKSVDAFFLKVDISNPNYVKTCLSNVKSRMQSIDVFINGSGIFDDMNPRRTMDVNLLGVIYTTLGAIDLMDKSKGGSGGIIINIASVAGLDPFPEAPVYSASKAGVVMFTRNLADDLHYQQTGVSLIVICPGVTDTKIVDHFKEDEKCKHVSSVRKMLDIVKIQKPDDCAKHILKTIELNKNGTVYVSYDGRLMEIPLKSWFSVARL